MTQTLKLMVFEPFNCEFLFFSIFFKNPSLAVIINHGYFSVGLRNTRRRFLTISACKKKSKDSQNLMSYEITQS